MLAAGLLLATALRAGPGGLLSSAAVSRTDGVTYLDVHFDCGVTYVGHQPAAAAADVIVQVSLLGGCGSRQPGGGTHETLRPAGASLAAIETVETTTRSASQAAIQLRFRRTVMVRPEPLDDARTLRLRIDPVGELREESVPMAGAIVQAPAAPVPTPAPAPPPRPVARAAPLPKGAGDYVLNLESSENAIDPRQVPWELVSRDQVVYLTTVEVSGTTWYRLRLGFFATEADAAAAGESLRAVFPKSWVVRIEPAEHETAETFRVSRQGPAAAAVATASGGGTALGPEARSQVMADARAALVARDYPRAIQLYSEVLAQGDTPDSPAAREFLGLAREKNNQVAQAIAEYRRYLELYPEGEDAERVRQRLNALITARDPPKAARQAQARPEDDRWDLFGGIAQFYQRDQLDFGGSAGSTTQSALLTDFDATVRRRGERFDLASRVTLGHSYGMSDTGSDSGSVSDARVYSLYVDLADHDTNVSGRFGRQLQRTSGMPGRFDGAQVSWNWRPDVRFNVTTGYAAPDAASEVDTSRPAYGASVDLARLGGLIDLSLYYNTQSVDGIQDRQAVGGEARWSDENRSLVTSLDYDTGYSELNYLSAIGNWRFESGFALNASADFRRSPFLSSENALIGQPVDSMAKLLQIYTEEEIRQFAADRSSTVQTFTLGASQSLSARFQLNADVTTSTVDGTPASGGVPGSPSTGTEYYYSTYLIGYSLLKEGDVSVVSLRYADASTASTVLLTLDNRYPVTEKLRVNPRLRVARREGTDSTFTEWVTAPSMRFFYRLAQHYRVELEAGTEWTTRDSAGTTDKTTGYFLYMGYQADF